MIEQPPIPGTWIGLMVGLFLGYIAVRFGFASVIVVAVCGAAGYWVTAFRRGDIDVVEGLSRLQQKERSF